MQGTLTFNLPEEQQEFRVASNAQAYVNVLWELDQQHMRPITKHGLIPENTIFNMQRLMGLKEKLELSDREVDLLVALTEHFREQLYRELSEENLSIP